MDNFFDEVDDFSIWERLQTEHSDDAEFVRYCQTMMDEADTRQDAERRKRQDDIRRDTEMF